MKIKRLRKSETRSLIPRKRWNFSWEGCKVVFAICLTLFLLLVGHSFIQSVDHTGQVEQENLSKLHDTVDTNKIPAISADELSVKNTVPPSRPPLVINHIPVPVNKKLDSTLRKYSYVSLLHGVDSTLAYRGYLYNILIAKKSLESLGSTADFTALVGFTYGVDPLDPIIQADFELLKGHNVKLHFLPRLNTWERPDTRKKVAFSEMALLKITPFSFLEYQKVQFLDGDVFPVFNMDCLFVLEGTVCNTGNASPLNSGWYVATPNAQHVAQMMALAIQRLKSKWNEVDGWGIPIPAEVYFRGGKKLVERWNFNGASLDQGLLFHYFALHNGGVQLLDVKTAKVYTANHSFTQTNDLTHVMRKCSGKLPMDMFHHFTGRSKPWLQDLSDKSRLSAGLKLWAQYLDELNLPLNSSNINSKLMAPPLGYFFPNK